MPGTKDDAIVVHLVATTPIFWKGRVDRRRSLSGAIFGLVIVVGAALRGALTGNGQLAWAILFAVAVIGLLILYGYMRLWNATVFLRGRNVGITNWLGLGRSVPTESVDHLRRTGEVWTGEKLSRGVLFIVTKDRKRSLRFAGGDRLEKGRIELVAAKIGVPIEGSWTDLPTWQP